MVLFRLGEGDYPRGTGAGSAGDVQRSPAAPDGPTLWSNNGRGTVANITKRAMALAGAAILCAGSALAQDDDLAFVGTSMFGEQEVEGGAGAEASGDFSAELDMKAGRMCYMLEVQGLVDFAAAHIHKGKRGENGPPVVTLELLGDDGEDVCVAVDATLLKDIAKNRAHYYVNVHTAAFPAGAIRGQLGVEE